ELRLRERRRREGEEERSDDEQALQLHASSVPKYATSDRPSSHVYASAYVTSAPSPVCLLATIVARRTTRTPIDLKKTTKTCICGFPPERAISSSSPCARAQRMAAIAQPPTLQCETMKIGSASAMTKALPMIGSRLLGIGRGVVNTVLAIRTRP